MFASKRTISSADINPEWRTSQEKQCYTQNTNLTSEIGNVITSYTPNALFSYSDAKWISVPDADPIIPITVSASVTDPIAASAVAVNSTQTYNISLSFSQLKSSIIARGTTYAANNLASRRGFVAENFVAETYNIDATIKKISDRAIVPGSNKTASADIIYDGGSKQASLKFYKDAKSSASAQTNPDYANQERIIPADQVSDGKDALNNMAARNELKGRTDAAKIQRDTANKIDSTIKGTDGAESTPLTKKSADNIAEAFSANENGEAVCNETKLDDAIKGTGITKKVDNAKIHNELLGIGIAAAIGFGTGFSIGFVVTLAQTGINPDSVKYALAAGGRQGAESAVVSGTGALIGAVAHNGIASIAESISAHMGYNPGSAAAQNIYTMCNMAIVGSLTIIAFSIYEFVKLKIHGYSTKECLIRTAKSAALQFTILIISIVAQGMFGGCAGIVVSISAGIIMTGYTVLKCANDRKVAQEITYFTIELCKPSFQTV